MHIVQCNMANENLYPIPYFIVNYIIAEKYQSASDSKGKQPDFIFLLALGCE